MITAALAERLAGIALAHVGRPYPYVLVHVVAGPGDMAAPLDQHPIFHGSFDWHSCVHGHWLLARVLRLHPAIARAEAIHAHFDAVFTSEKVAGELDYLARPHSAGFERPYGWAWLLMLASELRRHPEPWGERLRPLAEAFVARFKAFLPKADYPVRAGVHSNTAFALALAHDYVQEAGDDDLARLIHSKALAWYGADADCQAWEPSGDDFLSPALMEAELMRRLLSTVDFQAWFARFLPRAAAGEPTTLFRPAAVSDRGDGKIAHLDGLNLSRAWCWRGIAGALAPDDPLVPLAIEAADGHLAASLPHVSGDYAGEHWLASFALLALEA
jgi:hypothetical protein